MTDIDTFLEHHGVLGMHWGKHLPGKGVETVNKPRPTQTQIFEARARQAKRKIKLNAVSGIGSSNFADARKEQLNAAIKKEKKLAGTSANKIEKAARIQLGATVALGALSLVSGKLVSALPSAKARQGAAWVSDLSTAGTLAVALSTLITADVANKREKKFHLNQH